MQDLDNTSRIHAVLDFWFGPLDAHGSADAAHQQRWWRKDPEFDRSIREEFEGLHASIVVGELESWLATPRGRLAYVLVLDQLSRNMFRDTPAMFANDDRALAAALGGIERGHDRVLAVDHRAFLYMPLMHAESVEMQNRCVELFAALRDKLQGPSRDRVARNLTFAERHRDIVAGFGRFPHRNALLGRPSTPTEVEFLTQPGSSF